MARDSQAALVALNRFGFGARGGAAGDLVNAASDPRGFVKAELSRPSGLLLEVPGLLSTPALGAAVFAYQFEIQQAREAAAKSGASPASEAAPAQPATDAKAQKRNLSLNSIAMDISGKEPAMKTPDNGGGNAAMAARPLTQARLISPRRRALAGLPADTQTPHSPMPGSMTVRAPRAARHWDGSARL